jgi:sugar lactone lactonase YvrE
MEIHPVGQRVSKWGEGPLWWKGRLIYVDIEGRCVVAFDPSTGSEMTWDVGQRVGTVVPRENGGFVIAGDRGFFFLDDSTGELTPIADPESEQPNNRFNDGKCSPDGFFFAGSISLIKKTGEAALYRLSPEGQVTLAHSGVTNSNGLAWSADAKTLYYIDTPTKCVLAFTYSDGKISSPREVISTREIAASPDGMTIDAEGNLWIAFCHGACVRCYDPATGMELRQIDLPCLETTACTFGGEDLQDLYVTTGIHASEVEELAGRVFVIKGLGTRGTPAFSFKG